MIYLQKRSDKHGYFSFWSDKLKEKRKEDRTCETCKYYLFCGILDDDEAMECEKYEPREEVSR